MYVQKVAVAVTVSAGGGATVYSENVTGRLVACHYVKGNYDNGVDFDISNESTGEVLVDKDDVNASTSFYPRCPIQSSLGAGLTYDGTRTVNDYYHFAHERVKIVVAAGGNAKTGTFYFVFA